MSPAIQAKVSFLRMVEASLIAKPAPKNQDLILRALRQKKAALFSESAVSRIEGVSRIVVGF